MNYVQRLSALAAVCALFSACDEGSDTPNPPEEPLEGDIWPEEPKAERGPGAETDGYDFSTGSRPSAQARAGRHGAGPALFGGIDARCRTKDWVLENDHVRVCIAHELSPDQFFATGGTLIDMVPTAHPDGDELEILGAAVGITSLSADKVYIVRDGSDGGDAVLRVEGVDLPLKLAVGAMGSAAPKSQINVRAVTEYRLAPDSTYVEIVTWLKLDQPRLGRFKLGILGFFGDQTRQWAAGHGPGLPINGPYEFLTVVGEENTWGYYMPDAPGGTAGLAILTDALYLEYGVSGLLGNTSDAVFKRYMTVVRGGGSAEVAAAFDGLVDVPTGTEVTLNTPSAPGWSKGLWSIARVEGDKEVAIAMVRVADATHTLRLPPGDYVATPMSWPLPSDGRRQFSVGNAPSTATLAGPETYAVSLAIEDIAGTAIPAQVRVRSEDGEHQATFYSDGRHGPLVLPLGAGNYTAEVSRGEGWSFVEMALTGEATSQVYVAQLEELYDREGYVSGDFHQHSSRSIDSEVSSKMRLLSNLGTGADIFAPTDHDVVENYAYWLEHYGMEGLIHVFQGTEISPFRGHLNVFPTYYNEAYEAFGGGVLVERVGERGLRQRNTLEIMDDMYAQGVKLVQLNHGRDSTSGMLNWVRWDWELGKPTRNEKDWPSSIQTMEIYNRASVYCDLWRDWQAMLLRGDRVTGMGNSDTHTLSDHVGWPRNWLEVGESVRANLTDEAIRDTLTAGRVSVSGGILIRWLDHQAGDTVPVDRGPYTFRVQVDTPPWSSVETLMFFVNGKEAHRIEVGDDAMEMNHGEFTFTADLTSDSVVTVMGFSSRGMTAIMPGKTPFGFVNPIFMDVDRDGWTAPGVEAARGAEIPQGVPFCSYSSKSWDVEPDFAHARFGQCHLED